MDWKTIKQKAVEIKDKGKDIAEKTIPYFEKAATFTQNQFQASPLVLKNLEEYEKCKKDRKFLVIVVDKKEASYKTMLLKYPLFASKAWTMSATLRLIDISLTPDFIVPLKIESNPLLVIYYEEDEYKRLTGSESIANWFKNP